jgi:hypothetical protein
MMTTRERYGAEIMKALARIATGNGITTFEGYT